MKNVTLTLLVFLVSAGASHADSSWLARAKDAPLQLVGRCDSRSSRWEGGAIYSYCDVSVLRLVHGAVADGVVVRQRGGEVDGIAQKVLHSSLMEPGREYLFLLSPDGSGSWSPTSGGLLEVIDTPGLGAMIGAQPLDEVIRQLGGAN